LDALLAGASHYDAEDIAAVIERLSARVRTFS